MNTTELEIKKDWINYKKQTSDKTYLSVLFKHFCELNNYEYSLNLFEYCQTLNKTEINELHSYYINSVRFQNLINDKDFFLSMIRTYCDFYMNKTLCDTYNKTSQLKYSAFCDFFITKTPKKYLVHFFLDFI